MPKRPSFQYYPSDWRNDLQLQLCSLGARGLWLEMMNLMHESPRYGVLLVGGKAMGTPEISRAVGARLQDVRRLLEELETHNVFSRLEDGTIYCRRMVRDEHLRTIRAEAGAKGAAATNARLPGSLPTPLPDRLPSDLPQQNGQQNSGRPSRARAPSSSSSSLKTLSTPVSVVKPGHQEGALPPVVVADIPNGSHPPEIAEKIEREKRKLAQIATTGPPEPDSS